MSLRRRSRLVAYTVFLLAAFLVAGLIVLRSEKGSALSPGRLAQVHAHLDTGLTGEEHCADCHVGNRGLSNKLCLDCHQTLAARIEQKTGFHAGIGDAKCDDCHSEHLGRDARLVRWPAPDAPYTPIQLDKARKEDFPHGETTKFPLAGAHAKLACDQCHKPSLMTDPKVIEAVQGQETFLGVAKECGTCHVDVHVPTLGPDCAACHDAAAWKPAATFTHGDTRYPLVGKHEPVACDKCHRVETASGSPAPPSKPLPTFEPIPSAGKPRPFRGVGFGTVEPVPGDALPACRACHENVHRRATNSSFARCEDCHSPHDWKNSGQVAQGAPFDHSTTGFPLDGAHATTTCVACHGPKLDLAARRSCRECHEDDERKAHGGAFDREMAIAQKSCERCHDTKVWKPSTYAASTHTQDVPLVERHAIKCEDCHGTQKNTYPRLPIPSREVALTKIGPLDRTCVACHGKQDVHQGKLGTDCARCHDFKGFTLAKLSVEGHAEIGFPIVGKHLEVSCEGCHGARTPKGGLRQLALSEVKTQGCFACHGGDAPPLGQGDDPHRGQLGAQGKDCKSCHTETAWNPSTYDDARHQRARLPLQGAHKAVPCEACHVRDVQPAPLQQRFHWDTKALRCDQCHNARKGDDPHEGQFGQQDCSSCHVQEAWRPSTFSKSAHAQTGFPLVGNHDRECGACHLPVPGRPSFVHFASTPRECASCHVDAHLGQFTGRGGLDGCGRCHDFMDWKPSKFDHDRPPSRFPLTGKHREVECSACHVSASRQLPDGTTRDVVHYFPIEGRACDTCHVNPHAPGARDGK